MNINCPKCKSRISFTLSDSIDELGEVYMCPECNWKFRYVNE